MAINWISIKEKLPEDAKDVLILYREYADIEVFYIEYGKKDNPNKNLKICVGWFCDDSEEIPVFDTFIFNEGNNEGETSVPNVIAWAELPPIPDGFKYLERIHKNKLS